VSNAAEENSKMSNFNAVVTMMSKMSRSTPAIYKLSVYPCYYQGPIASIDYDTYGGFACAVKRIGIEGEALRKLTGQIESGESISHLDFALSAPDAAYFGWSRN
jgi:hypothetical protein